MKHLEDKRLCHACLAELHERPYLMARQAEEWVLSPTLIAWIVVLAMAALVIAH